MTENWLLFALACLIALVLIVRMWLAHRKAVCAMRNPKPAARRPGQVPAPESVPPLTAMPPTALESQEMAKAAKDGAK